MPCLKILRTLPPGADRAPGGAPPTFQCRPATIVIAAVLLFAAAGSAQAGRLVLAWDANSEPDLAGYYLYYGNDPGTYTGTVKVTSTSCAVEGLIEGARYYFAVKAFNSSGRLSEFSNEVSGVVPASPAAAPNPGSAPNPTATPQPAAPPVSGTIAPGPRAGSSADLGGNPADAAAGAERLPETPILIAPSEGEASDLPVVIATDPAHAPDLHAKTRWQIRRVSDGLVVLDLASASALTRLDVNGLILDPGTTYRVRCRLTAASGIESDWSAETRFSIRPEASPGTLRRFDTAVQAVSLSAGEALPGGDGPIPADGGDATWVGLVDAAAGTRIEAASAYAPEGAGWSEATLLSKHFAVEPFGLRIRLTPAGGEAVMNFSSPSRSDRRWVVLDGTTDGEMAVAADESGTASITDGGAGDLDGSANGVVVLTAAALFERRAADGAGAAGASQDHGGNACFVRAAGATQGPPAGLILTLAVTAGLIGFAGCSRRLLRSRNRRPSNMLLAVL